MYHNSTLAKRSLENRPAQICWSWKLFKPSSFCYACVLDKGWDGTNMSWCIGSAHTQWDICFTYSSVKIDKPILVAIIKPTHCVTDCTWQVVRYCWIFESIFACWYCRSAILKDCWLDKFERRKKVACFKIMITAFRKVNYTLKMINLNTKDQMMMAKTVLSELEN